MNQFTQQDLRNACHDLHANAEQTKWSQSLINGSVDPILYKNYCYQLYLITDAIETKVSLPLDLIRRHKLVDDIARGPGCTVVACPSTITYVKHINSFFIPHVHGQLKAHIYTHYLGWLYGGQMIAKKLQFLPKSHLEFSQPKASVDYIRNTILALITEKDLQEARLAFSSIIQIYDELYELHRTS